MKVGKFQRALSATGLLMCCSIGASAQTWQVTDIGSGLTATGVNDLGQVVGTSAGFGFVTGANGVGMTVLSAPGWTGSYANGINNAGQVVGTYTSTSDTQAFVTGANAGTITTLGVPGSSQIYGTAINASGQVVIAAFPTTGYPTAYVVSANGQSYTPISLPAGVSSTGGNIYINNSGQVAGAAINSSDV